MNIDDQSGEANDTVVTSRDLLGEFKAIFDGHPYAKGSRISRNDVLPSLESSFRVWQLDDAGSAREESLPFVNPRFLQIARGGFRAVAIASLRAGPFQHDRASTRSRANADAITTGVHVLLSPFSGQLATVRSSLGQQWFVHKAEDGEVCLISQMCETMMTVDLETVWLFPQRNLLLFVNANMPVAAVLGETARMIADCINHAEKLAGYLAMEGDGARRIGLTDFFCPHLAHNLWNLQTGWANTLRMAGADKIAHFAPFANQNFFGSLSELFPDYIGDASCVVPVVKEEDIFVQMLDENLLMLTVKDEYITPDLASRILRRAEQSCSAAFLDDVAALRKRARPLLVTTVRLGNRQWLEQREGIPALFKALLQVFPQCGVILDGLSGDTIKGWTTEWMSLAAEQDVAADILGVLSPVMPVISAIGRTIAEAITLVAAADAFIAPTGSGMTLYKWVANKPGIAFSSSPSLDTAHPFNWALRVWHNPQFRPDITPTIHLLPGQVEDVIPLGQDPTRADFHLNWRSLLETALPLIMQLPLERRPRLPTGI